MIPRSPRASIQTSTLQAAACALMAITVAACTFPHSSFRAKGPTPFAVAAAANQPFIISEPKAPPGVTQTSVTLARAGRVVVQKDAPHLSGQRFNFGTLKDGDYSLVFNWDDRSGHSAYRGTASVHVVSGRATPTTVVVSPIGSTQPVPVIAKLEVTH